MINKTIEFLFFIKFKRILIFINSATKTEIIADLIQYCRQTHKKALLRSRSSRKREINHRSKLNTV